MILQLVTFVIILSSGALAFRTYTDIALLSVLFLLIVKKYQKKSSIIISPYSLAMIFLLILQYNVDNITIKTLIGISLKLYIVMLVGVLYSYELFWKTYIKQLFVISSLSMLTFVFYNIFGELPGLSIPKTVWEDNRHFNYIIAIFPIHSYFPVFRNQSIFWEPGAFQYFVNLALMVNLVIFSTRLSDKKNIVFIATILSTFSTTGYIVFGIILISALRSLDIKYVNQLKLGLIIVITIITIIFSGVVTDKIGNNENVSYLRRINDTRIDYLLIKENPIIGYGIDNPQIWRAKYYRAFGLYDDYLSSSNSLLNSFAQFGILFMLIYLFPLFYGKALLFGRGEYLITIMVCLATEHFIFSPLFMATMMLRHGTISSRVFKI